MDNSELLKIINELKKENEALKQEKAKLENKNLKLEDKNLKLENKMSKLEVELYEANKRLNEALLTIASIKEKEKIERTRIFIQKSEKLNEIVINEAEEIIKIG